MSQYISRKQWRPSEDFRSTNEIERIIKEEEQNISVLAGPGSGKTELLAQRASYLLQTGACKSPQKILALSFKVDAAKNIKSRVDLRCGRELGLRFDSSTFDAFFTSIARRFSSLLPSWIKMSDDFDVDITWWSDYAKCILNNPKAEYEQSYSPLDLTSEPNGDIIRIWDYCAEKKVANFYMCRSMAYTIAKNYKQVRNLILSTYKYLFLDEFQDTTHDQYSFLKTVFEGSDTIITAVGDTNQMIMGWADADYENFKRLESDFYSKNIPLAINHRSNSKIVSLINHVIKFISPQDVNTVIYLGSRDDDPPDSCIRIEEFNDSASEAKYICEYMNHILQENPTLKPSDFAIILRQKAQDYFNEVNPIFANYSIAMRNEDQFVVEGGVKFQELIFEPISILFILLIRKKVGNITYTQEKDIERYVSYLTGYDLDHDRDRNKLIKYIENIITLIDFSISTNNFIDVLVNTIGRKKIQVVFPQYRPIYLDRVIKSFCCLFDRALQESSMDVYKAIDIYEGVNQVKLMTIHKSKGLEFDTVFFVDIHKDSWWSLLKAEPNSNKEREEINSFFVGLSRAKERLVFTKNKGDWPPVLHKLISETYSS